MRREPPKELQELDRAIWAFLSAVVSLSGLQMMSTGLNTEFKRLRRATTSSSGTRESSASIRGACGF